MIFLHIQSFYSFIINSVADLSISEIVHIFWDGLPISNLTLGEVKIIPVLNKCLFHLYASLS